MKWSALLFICFSGISLAHAQPAPSQNFYDQTGKYQGQAQQNGGVILFYDKTGKYAGDVKQQDDGSYNQYDATGKYVGTVRPGN
jgi:hypothetical protein